MIRSLHLFKNLFAFSFILALLGLANTVLGQNSTGWLSPTTNPYSNNVNNPTYVYFSDNQRSTFDTTNDIADYGGFSLIASDGGSIPSNAIIVGIEVGIQGYNNNDRGLEAVSLSWNNGQNFSTSKPVTFNSTESYYIIGNNSDEWGHTWTISDLSNSSFRIRLDPTFSVGDLYINHIQIRVSYNLPTPCGYEENTSANLIVTPCINMPSNPELVSSTIDTKQYFLLNVIKGLTYQIYTNESPNTSSALKLTVYEEGNPSGSVLACSETNNAENTSSNDIDDVYLSFTSSFSGQVRVLINHRSSCGLNSKKDINTYVNVREGQNTQDTETTAGTDTWIGHIYDNTNSGVAYDGTFNNYLGYYTQSETFQESFGTGGTWPNNNNDDAICFNLYSDGSIRGSVKDVTYSVRYRMNSTKRGLYKATLVGDDGNRLSVDGSLVYSDWSDHSPATHDNVLFSLSGSSNLVLDYYENGGQNVVGFYNLAQIIANNLSTNTSQSICIGSSGNAISGDVFPTLTGTSYTGLSNPRYQWAYSTSSTGPWTDISGATNATYTPNSGASPFNSAGTYYIVRKAILSSANNVSPNPYVATHVSNAATITVNTLPAINSQPTNQGITYGSDASFTVSATGTGISYQWQEYISTWNNITNGGVYSNATTATLNLTKPTVSMSGRKYRCIVTGACAPVAQSNEATLTVNKAALTVTASAQSKTYGSTVSTSGVLGTTFTVSGLKSGDVANGATLGYSGSPAGNLASAGAGTYTITPSAVTFSTGSINNYTVSYVTGILTVNKAILTPVIVANNKCFDGLSVATLSSQSVTGTFAPDVVILNVSSVNFNNSTIGNGKTVMATGLTLGGAGANNYSLSSTTATTTANIYALPTANVSGSTTICSGTSANLSISLTGNGPWNFTYTDGTTPVSVTGQTTSPFIASVSPNTTKTYSVTSVSDTNCTGTYFGNSASITVDPSTQGGTISGAVSPTCLNSGSGVLTLSGHLGTIVRWERNINSNGWTNIGNAGSTTFTEPNFYSAGTWQYRVVVKNASCTETYSSVANITVDPTSVGGSISYADPICEGSSVSLTLNGSTGAVLRWERRLGSGSWETVAQTTTIITDTPTSGGTWEYRAVVQSGNCNVVYSTSQTVVVNPTLTITLGANPEVCQTITSTSLPFSATTGNPSGWILTFDAAAVSAGFNNPQNGSLGSAPGNIPINVPYNIAVGVYHATLKIRTYSPNCFSTDYPVTITVGYSTVAGTASAGSTEVCRNSGTTLTLVGSVGSIQWQTNASGTWQDISGATSATYVTPNLVAATSYRARVTSGSCSSMESNVVAITVDSQKPVLANCPSGTLTFAPDAGLCSASINTTTWGQSPAVSATDNCDTAPVINFTRSDGQTNSTFPIGSTTVTLTATDNNGNVSTGCTFTVLVRETTPPSITCPPGQTIFCAANIPAAYTTFAAFQAAGGTASDNAATGCGLSEGTFHLAAQVTSGSTITRTYEIADYSGNTATCNQVFTIISPPTVSITSPGFNITCAGSGFTIHSSVNSYSGITHYQWQFKAFNGSSWTVVGGDTPSYSGTLANLGDQYRLIISQSTDFSNVSCTSISNELKFMDVTKPVFVIGNAPVNQTICIANGATAVSVTNIRLNNEDVADNCTTVFGDLAISYTINGGASVSGNLAEGTSFSLGTSTVVYTVADQSGNYETHTFTITVNENPALADITPDASGLTPDQGSTHSYSVPAEAGYTFTWSVEKEISSGNYSAVSPLITGQGSATVNITWGAATMPGNYRIAVVKENNSTNCEATKTLNVKVLNVFNPFVKDYGNSCHNVTGETIIDWIVELSNNSMLGGTYNWSFKWRIKLGAAEIAIGTESGVTTISKTISYTVNIGDGSEKNYRFEIYDVNDALGNQETSTTDDTDEVKIFAKPSIQF
jgi:hypothetical protein